MFKTLKYYKHIVSIGYKTNELSKVLSVCKDTHPIKFSFQDVESNSLIITKDKIPFDSLKLEDFFFLVKDDSFDLEKVCYGYQILSNPIKIDNIKDFKFYHNHLDFKKVLSFDLGANTYMDIVNNNDVLFSPSDLTESESKMIAHKTRLPVYKRGMTLAQEIKKITAKLSFDSLQLNDKSYCLVNYNNKIFPFRFQGNTEFDTRFYRLKLKSSFQLN